VQDKESFSSIDQHFNVCSAHAFGCPDQEPQFTEGQDHRLEKVLQQLLSSVHFRLVHFNAGIEPPPHRHIEQVIMIGCGQSDAYAVACIKRLEQRIHDTLDLADLLSVIARLRDRIEFVEKQNATVAIGVFEQRSYVPGRCTQERRNQPVKARFHAGQPKLLGQIPC
jgi:hypothetical protein